MNLFHLHSHLTLGTVTEAFYFGKGLPFWQKSILASTYVPCDITLLILVFAGDLLHLSTIRQDMQVYFVRVRGLLISQFTKQDPYKSVSSFLLKSVLLGFLPLISAGLLEAQKVTNVVDFHELSAASTTPIDAPAKNSAGLSSDLEAGNGAPPAAVASENILPNVYPDSPLPQNSTDSQQANQTKRILGIIPNFRAVSSGQKLPPQSVKDKFVTATQDSFDYSSILIPAVVAGYSMETNATPEFHQGAAGYARYFWHAAVDQTSENYMVEFLVPVVTHEDTRYYTLGSGGFLKRTGYALTRTVVTRSDSAHEVFNFSEVVGSGASAGLSSLYYPTRERSFGNTGKEWGLDIGIDAVSFVAKEFWPDINHRLFGGVKPAVVPQH